MNKPVSYLHERECLLNINNELLILINFNTMMNEYLIIKLQNIYMKVLHKKELLFYEKCFTAVYICI